DKRSEIFNFFKCLINKCCLVIVSTSSQKSAFRIFSVMNNRGLDLLPIDILKADLIGKIKDNQKKYTEKWENLEQELGRDSFNDLFSHIRMIKLKKKAEKSILEELQEKVFKDKTDKEICAFISEELISYVDVFSALKNNHYPAEKHQQKINQHIQWLTRVGFSEWIPVAILFLHQKPNNDEALEFLKKLEVLTAYLHLSAQDINSRIKRYGQILESLGEKAKNGGDSLLLSDEEKRQFKALLNGDIYNKMTSVRRNYLILRLDSMVSDGAATYNNEYGLLTIEHVLPQTLEENTQWYEWWVDESKENEAEKYHQHQLWLHRLANLVPLNKRRNSAASNWDFGEKINKYFRGNENVSSYALTTQVLKQSEWRPKDVEERQKNLLERICEVWDLPKD
ncbi:HNH endonuclease family protein, partial [Avibacterium paragallinarum]